MVARLDAGASDRPPRVWDRVVEINRVHVWGEIAHMFKAVVLVVGQHPMIHPVVDFFSRIAIGEMHIWWWCVMLATVPEMLRKIVMSLQ
jgi:hypothetical protein